MRIGDIITLRIESYGMSGEGIARESGFTVFVPYAMAGERVKVIIDRVQGSTANAHIIKMEEESADRRKSFCAVFGKCGGCTMQHIPYHKQLEIKKENINRLLSKNAGMDARVSHVVASEEQHYRNKVSLPFGLMGGVPSLGFYKAGTHKLIAIRECPLHEDWVSSLIDVVLGYAADNSLSVYDEATGKGLLRHLVARRLKGEQGYVYGIVIVANGDKLPMYSKLADRLKIALCGEINLYLNTNTQRNNVILSDKIIVLEGGESMTATIGGISAEVSPLSFLQVNEEIAEKIYTDVLNVICPGDTVVDAYSGTGIMTVMLSAKASRVYGIEIVPDAVQNARRNVELNGAGDRVTNICGDVAVELPVLQAEIKSAYTLVLDPPRAGVSATVIGAILEAMPQKIIYISCNPATLTRDIGLLGAHYKADRITAYDMFPQTASVETVVCLTAKM